MPYSEHDEVFKQLQGMYRCDDCDPSGIKWCWKQTFKGWPKHYHAPLDAKLLNTWATYVVDKIVTIYHPPRIPEFDDVILAPLYKKNKHHAPQAMPNETLVPQLGGGLLREFHVYHGSSNRHKRHRDYESDTPTSSPIKRK